MIKVFLYLVNDKSNFYCFKLFSLFLFILRYFVTNVIYEINVHKFMNGHFYQEVSAFLEYSLLNFDKHTLLTGKGSCPIYI